MTFLNKFIEHEVPEEVKEWIKGEIEAQDINDITYGYPIYDSAYKMSRGKIIEFLGENSIIACGRYGSWSYMSMEDVMLEAQSLAEMISHNGIYQKS